MRNIDENICRASLMLVAWIHKHTRNSYIGLDYQHINLVFPNVYRQTRNGYQKVANKWTSVFNTYNSNYNNIYIYIYNSN